MLIKIMFNYGDFNLSKIKLRKIMSNVRIFIYNKSKNKKASIKIMIWLFLI